MDGEGRMGRMVAGSRPWLPPLVVVTIGAIAAWGILTTRPEWPSWSGNPQLLSPPDEAFTLVAAVVFLAGVVAGTLGRGRIGWIGTVAGLVAGTIVAAALWDAPRLVQPTLLVLESLPLLVGYAIGHALVDRAHRRFLVLVCAVGLWLPFAAAATFSILWALSSPGLGEGDVTGAIELAKSSLAILEGSVSDEAASTHARQVLAQALTAAGRAEEAVPILASLIAASGTVAPEDAAEVAALMAEISAEAGGEAATDASPVPAVPVPTPPHLEAALTAADEWGRVPRTGWIPRPVPVLTEIHPSELGALVTEVVTVEGPVTAGRVYRLLRTASGVSRQGRLIRSALDSGVRSALRRGALVASVPDARGDSSRRVLRLATQPEVLLRELGDRTPDEVPSGELTELARRVLLREPDLTRPDLKRRLAPLLGASVLGKPLDELLEAELPASFGMARPPVEERDEWGRTMWIGWEPHGVSALTDLKPAELAGLIQEVVRVEGPVMVGRVYDLLRQASGAARLGRVLRDTLDAGVNSGVRRGDLIVTPGRRNDADSRVLRLPSQPGVRLRTPGDRGASSIPPSELAELARRVLLATPGADRDGLKRQLARILGWGRYTQAVDELLEYGLAADLGGGTTGA